MEVEEETRFAVEAECEERNKNALDSLVSWYEDLIAGSDLPAVREAGERESREASSRRMAEEIYATPTRGNGGARRESETDEPLPLMPQLSVAAPPASPARRIGPAIGGSGLRTPVR